MTVKELIKQLNEVENKNKEIYIIGNESNGEDEDFDVNFQHLEIWNDGDDSITLFLTN